MHDNPTTIAKAAFRAYVANDREAIEALTADDLRFTSPFDNGIGRTTYFERCWPNHQTIAEFDFLRIVEAGAEVIVTYACTTSDGRGFRNTEVLTIVDGQIHAVEVYFGWSVPHPAKPGGFVDKP